MASSQNVNIPSLIEQTQGQDNRLRSEAEKTLQQLQLAHFPNYLLELCRILKDQSVSSTVRQGAGLLLKNAITTSRGDITDIRRRWAERLDGGTRHKIKQSLLDTLAFPDDGARQTAVIVISNLALVETLTSWKDLIPTLLAKAASSEMAMAAALRCIGQIAESEELHDDLQQFSPKILECIARGMSTAQNPSASKAVATVQWESMRTLHHIVELIDSNMSQPQQQRVIMQMVCCGASRGPNHQLRMYSFMSIARIVDLYYGDMKPFMQRIFQISKGAIDGGIAGEDDEEVTKQAIEVWSTTAEMEADILSEHKEAGGPTAATRSSHGFVAKSLELLVPVFLKALLLQKEDFDADEWTVRKASACCLELFAHVVGDHILKYVLSFVEQHIGSSSWRSREAALCSFGAVLDGPSKEKLGGLVRQILRVVVKLTADCHSLVRLTAVWVLGRICQVMPEAATKEVMAPLVAALNGDAAMADKACWCIASLCCHQGVLNDAQKAWIYSGDNGMQMISQLLTRCAKRDMKGQHVLNIHEALNTLIAYAPAADERLKKLLGQQLLPELVKRLSGILQAMGRANGGDDIALYRMAGFLSTIQVTLQMVDSQCFGQELADDLMECCVRLLAGEQSLVYEEALSTVPAIAKAVKSNFMKYLLAQQVQDLLAKAVRNGTENEDICQVAVGCLCEVYSACSEAIVADPLPLRKCTDRMVSELLSLLIDAQISLTSKHLIVETLTDIMLAHGNRASRYSGDILEKCLEIGVLRPPPSADEELWADFNCIRAAIGDTVRACLMEMSEGNPSKFHGGVISKITSFVEAVAADLQKADKAVLLKCVLLLGDAAMFSRGSPLKNRLKTQSAQQIIQLAASQGADEELAAAANNAFSTLNAQ